MATAQEIFEAMLRGPVAKALRDLGFTGTFRAFSLRAGEYQGIVHFQKSRYSTADEIPSYQALLSIRHIPTKSRCWGDVVLRGILPQARSHPQYSLTADQSPDEAAAKIVGDLQGYGYPALIVGLAEPDFDKDRSDRLEAFRDAESGLRGPLFTYFTGITTNPFGWDLETANGLLELTHHQQAEVRRSAADWLVYRFPDDARVTPRMVALAMDDTHSAVRAMALSLLVYRQGSSEVSAALSNGLDDPSYQVRWWARYGRRVRACLVKDPV